ncbi:MAG: YgjV family protein [Ruminococcaceae bacterium]|nr:YgjV family protein [Oscillospiraceae bacterium]
MNIVVLGNVISFIGCALMVAIGLIKSKKAVLAAQCVQFTIQAAANLILGAVSGAICGLVGIARNLMITRVKHVTLWKILFIGVQAGLTFLFDGFGLLVWLPIVSAAIFTWLIDAKSPVLFKVSIILAQSLWVVYDLCYQNYAALTFDVFTILSNLVGIWLIRREEGRQA